MTAILAFILEWWWMAPTVVTGAGIIAKATPNKTDDKILGTVMKVVDLVALHPEVTKLVTKKKK